MGAPVSMNTKTRLYLLLVILAAVAVLPFQDWAALGQMPLADLKGLVAFLVLGVSSEMLSVSASVGSHKWSTSIAFLPFFACLLLFPPAAAIGVVVLTSLPTQLIVHKRPLFRSLFNVSQWAICTIIASAVYKALGGVPSNPVIVSGLGVGGFLRLAALSLTFLICNQLFVGIAIGFATGTRLRTAIRKVIAPSGANLFYDALVSPIAFVVAILYSTLHILGLFILSLPLLIIRHSYKSVTSLQQANEDLLSVLVKTIETRDPYTSGHSIRVSILARAIAEDMKLTAQKVDKVEMAALVHDIGKVDAIYASLIRKEGSLTDAERGVIVTHAAKGAEFLETLSSFDKNVIGGVRHHHERFDGTGYPEGLSGDEIPQAARIIQLCDSIDAMLSDRPYRKALSIDQVRSELLRCSGSQFDPRIVEIILKRNTLERAAALVRPESVARRVAVSA